MLGIEIAPRHGHRCRSEWARWRSIRHASLGRALLGVVSLAGGVLLVPVVAGSVAFAPASGAGLRASLSANAAANQKVTLASVSCASAGDCSAVGSYIDSSGDTQGVSLTESSGAWAPGVQAILPADAASSPVQVQDVVLASVSCVSAGDCSAVGSYTDSSSRTQGVLLTESSGAWAPGVQATLPADASGTRVSLASVSCASAGDCSAVGSYTDNSGA